MFARIGPAASTVDHRINHERERTLHILIERFGLGVHSALGQLLLQQAWSPPDRTSRAARRALALYLRLPDVSDSVLRHLEPWWRSDEWGSAALREAMERRRPDGGAAQLGIDSRQYDCHNAA